MNVIVEGPAGAATPAGRANRLFADALRDLGLVAALEECRTGTEATKAAGGVAAIDEPMPDVRIRRLRQPGPRRRGDNSRLVLHQTWEFGAVPLAWLECLQAADAIWVPSLDVKSGYVRSGLAPESIWVVPDGIGAVTKVVPSRPSSPTTLLFMGGTAHRNGLDVLASALDQLRDEELFRVRLLVDTDDWYSDGPAKQSLGQILSAVPRVAARTAVVNLRAPSSEPPIAVTAVVHPYRAESFGAPILEFMALGIPAIVTAGGATDEYCSDETALRVASSLSIADTPYLDGTLTVDLPRTFEPSVDALVQHLRTAIFDRARVATIGAAASRVARTHTWQDAARHAAKAIAALAEGQSAEDRFTGTARAVDRFTQAPSLESWVSATQQLLEIGDPHGALRLSDVAVSLLAEREVTKVRHTLSGATNTKDVWSAAVWRVNLAAFAHTMRTERVAHRYEGDLAAVTEIASAMAPYFSGCQTVLDIGCGKGAMLRTLRSSGVTVTGIDGDPELVSSLAEEAFEVYEAWLPEGLDVVGDRRFDGMFLGHIIEHLTTADAAAVLSWAADHMNDGGVIAIQTPDFSVDFVSGTNFWLDSTHIRPYPLGLLKSLLEDAGFSPLASGCRSLAPHAPLDILAVGKFRRPRLRAPVAASRTAQRVLHLGLFSGTSGMAVQTKQLLNEQLLAEGNVSLERVDLGNNPSSALREALALPSRVAVIDVPPGWLPTVLPYVRAAKTVIRLAYEATPLPPELAKRVAAAEEIWTMSRFVSDACRAAGVPDHLLVDLPVHVPHDGTDDRTRAQELATPITFCSVFNFEPRKNPEALLVAFSQLLARGHDARLLIKTGGIDTESFWQWCSKHVEPARFEAVQRSTELYTAILSETELRTVFARSHAFVLPTRGEGFGIPFLEAMGMGLPVVCPDRGGHLEFVSEKNALLVPCFPVPCAASCALEVFRGASWFDVDVDALTDAMEFVVRHPDAAREVGHRARQTAIEWSLRDVPVEASRRLLRLVRPG